MIIILVNDDNLVFLGIDLYDKFESGKSRTDYHNTRQIYLWDIHFFNKGIKKDPFSYEKGSLHELRNKLLILHDFYEFL